MRHLPLALALSLVAALSHAGKQHDHHHHDSLPSHQHGSAELDAALDGRSLELELRSPAINLLGFEHSPRSQAEQQAIAATRQRLEQPAVLFGLPAEAACRLQRQALESPLFQQATGEQQHSDIHAHYRFECDSPAALRGLALKELFAAFPGIDKLRVQLAGPQGQKGIDADAARARVDF